MPNKTIAPFFCVLLGFIHRKLFHRMTDVGDTSFVRPLSTVFAGCAHSIILDLCCPK
jgi:hypothetical protein